MPVRTQKEIDFEIKAQENILVNMVEVSVDAERYAAKKIEKQEDKLKTLRTESSFENTLTGIIEQKETKAFKAIEAILEYLTTETGKEYPFLRVLNEIMGDG